MSRAGETVNKQLIQNGATIAQWIRHHAVLGSNLKDTIYASSIYSKIFTIFVIVLWKGQNKQEKRPGLAFKKIIQYPYEAVVEVSVLAFSSENPSLNPARKSNVFIL